VSTESINPIMLALNAGLLFSEKGSPDTKLSPPSSSAAMLSTVTHCWTMRDHAQRDLRDGSERRFPEFESSRGSPLQRALVSRSAAANCSNKSAT